MKILYFDNFSGISGDMAIGALLDLGVDQRSFLNELKKLNLGGYRVEITRKTQHGISGTDFNVILDEEEKEHELEDEHYHEHMHEEGHEHIHGEDHGNDSHGHMHEAGCVHEDGHEHMHGEGCEHLHEGGHSQPDPHGHCHDDNPHEHSHSGNERNLADIELLLDRSNLSDPILNFSKKVFREIAAAEAKVHNKPVDEVHFHEVGAVDSIVDIAGTAICLEMLGVDSVYSSALHDGSGFITCRHGVIPVPVPAVMEMLSGSGIPLVTEDVGTELVTPTGMGLIKCLAKDFGSMPPMRIEKTGYGLGKRETGRLNALRVVIGETFEAEQRDRQKTSAQGKETAIRNAQAAGYSKNAGTSVNPPEEVIVLETNIDDTTGEILGFTMAKLLEAGALDAFHTPVFMKKNRPAVMLSVLAKPGTEDLLAGILFSETSTIGVRMYTMKRYCMERSTVQVQTPYGSAAVKIARIGDTVKSSPEYEDCRRIAENSGLPLRKVYELVTAEAAKQYEI